MAKLLKKAKKSFGKAKLLSDLCYQEFKIKIT